MHHGITDLDTGRITVKQNASRFFGEGWQQALRQRPIIRFGVHSSRQLARNHAQNGLQLRLIGHLGSDQDAIAVRIGSEHEYEGLRSTSVVTAGYGPGTELLGGIGVLGPTRMDYPATMAAVRTVARYVSEILAP